MSRHRRVNYPQLESLWEAVNSYRVLATGYSKTAQARENSKQLWMRVATMLNSHGDGAIKDWKGWCKYWNDYKSKLKSKVAAARASHTKTGGGPAESKSLTDIDKKFLQVLGEDFGSGLPGIRVDPFKQTSFEQMEHVEPDIPEVNSESILLGHDMSFILDARTSPQPGPSAASLPDSGGCSIPLPFASPSETASLPTQSPTPQVVARPIIAPGAPRTSQRSPRRRRRVAHREPPMTQEMARRTLVQLSERNTRTAERHCQLLENLVNEIREIKEILNLRSVYINV